MSVLDEIAAEVQDDPDSIGLILHGSRAAGVDGRGELLERRPDVVKEHRFR